MNANRDFVKNINLFGGVIEYDDFFVNPDIPFEKQLHAYKEDMLQISFGKNFLIDVGYYPEMDPKGCFVVYAIQGYDWINPLVEIECRSLSELKKTIEETAALLSEKNNGEIC